MTKILFHWLIIIVFIYLSNNVFVDVLWKRKFATKKLKKIESDTDIFFSFIQTLAICSA